MLLLYELFYRLSGACCLYVCLSVGISLFLRIRSLDRKLSSSFDREARITWIIASWLQLEVRKYAIEQSTP